MSKQSDNNIKSAQMEKYPEPDPQAKYQEEAREWLNKEQGRAIVGITLAEYEAEFASDVHSLAALLERLCGEAAHAASEPRPPTPEFLAAIEQARKEGRREQREKYYELLYAVSNKYPGESRHETALRYIREHEQSSNVAAKGSKP